MPRPEPRHRARAALLVLLASLLPAQAVAAALQVAVISDLNGAYGSRDYRTEVAAAVDRIIALRPALVLSTGDMVAGQRRPHLRREELEAMWAAFHRAVSDPLAAAGIPLAVSPGNHDASGYRGFELEREVYAEQWRARRPDVRFLDGGHYPFRYAFTLGGTLFVALDATTAGALDPAQQAWLEALLATRGDGHRYRVLFGHLPPWPFARGRESETIGSGAFQRLLEAEEVDLHLSGHHHAFYPGSRGPVAFVSQACLGSGPRALLGTTGRSHRALTVLELGDAGIAVAALTGESFDRPLDWRTLPGSLRHGSVELLRADRSEVLRPLAWGPAP